MTHALTELMARQSHPWRTQLTAEMHVRQFPVFEAPARLSQLVTLSGDGNGGADHAQAAALCQAYGVAVPDNDRYFHVALGGVAGGDLHFVWERHTEFATWTFIKSQRTTEFFQNPVAADLPASWLENFPGRIIRATQIELLDRAAPEPSVDQLKRYFNAADLVACDVMNGAARIWSDFRLHADGFGRLLIHDHGLTGGDTARLVQRLQELGNYRKVALMGLKPAQTYTPTVTELEIQLTNIAGQIAAETGDEKKLLHDLSALAAELARIAAETRYRMSATTAYAQLVTDRLRDIGVGRLPGYQTLFDFTDRRLTPAVRTCQSFTARLENLSLRANQATSLLRTRLDMALTQQNIALLASMDRRAHMQLRLQQTVEGLSVAAISYYVVGLLGYLAKAGERLGVHAPHDLVMGLGAPVVVLAVWYVIRKVRLSVERTRQES